MSKRITQSIFGLRVKFLHSRKIKMEHQIERTISSSHDLFVNGQWFIEKKVTEELPDVVKNWHTRQIDDEDIGIMKWYAIVQTIDKDGQVIDESIQKFPEDLDIDSFMTEWESGWNPTLGQESTGDLEEINPMDILKIHWCGCATERVCPNEKK